MSPIQRFEYAQRNALCINCLAPQHTVRQCKSSSCKRCKSMHHTLLHRNPATDNNNSNSTMQNHQSVDTQQQFVVSPQQSSSQNWHQAAPFAPTGTNSNISTATTMLGEQRQFKPHTIDHTILATAIVEIYDNCERKYFAKALLDSESQVNFITQDMLQKLNLSKAKTSSIIGGIGQSTTFAKWSTTARIKSRTSDYSTTLPFIILPNITGLQPHNTIDKTLLNIPTDLNLADPQFHIPQPVDLLIGADIFFELFDGKQMTFGANCPALMSTVFGWIISGRLKATSIQHSLVTCKEVTEPHLQLEELVKQFWELEKVPEANRKLSKEHSECEDHFMKHTKRLQSGRFQVNLPFKLGSTVLGDSLQMATRPFYSLEKRLATNVQLKQDYVQFMEQYKNDGHMTELELPESLNGWYTIPHHCVLRPDKSTTKCTVVFDASAKTKNNLSLNDILKVEPVVQNDLVDVLLRFRLHKYGIMADITAMYGQILVSPEDRKVQTIVWRNNETERLKFYNSP